MTAGNATSADESLDVMTDALLTASRLLVAISARSAAPVDRLVSAGLIDRHPHTALAPGVGGAADRSRT